MLLCTVLPVAVPRPAQPAAYVSRLTQHSGVPSAHTRHTCHEGLLGSFVRAVWILVAASCGCPFRSCSTPKFHDTSASAPGVAHGSRKPMATCNAPTVRYSQATHGGDCMQARGTYTRISSFRSFTSGCPVASLFKARPGCFRADLDLISAHLRALARLPALRGAVLTLAAPLPAGLASLIASSSACFRCCSMPRCIRATRT